MPNLLKLSEIIDRQSKHMARLLDDLMDVSRITQNRIELRKEKIALSSAISAALEACAPLIEAKKHDLQVTLPPDAVGTVCRSDAACAGPFQFGEQRSEVHRSWRTYLAYGSLRCRELSGSP